MLRSNKEVYVSMYGQQTYDRMIVGLYNKLPGLGTRTSLGDDSDYCLDLEEVGIFTPHANEGLWMVFLGNRVSFPMFYSILISIWVVLCIFVPPPQIFPPFPPRLIVADILS